MQWWCAAQGVPWEWTWRPYPGVWLFVLLLAGGYGALLRRSRRGSPGPGAPRARGDGRGGHGGDGAGLRRRALAFGAGLLLLWVALDWPVGALGAGYLASVHMVQFLLVALAAPPLLLYGLPPGAVAPLAGARAAGALLRGLTHPVAALLLFGAVLLATHWPDVVDALMASQAGSFVLDMAWLGAGLVFWWPVVVPVPRRPRFPYPVKIGYLVLATIVNTAPFALLTFSHLPLYATYELAPPIAWLSTRADQRVAGLLMKMGGAAILWTGITLLFVRWYRASEGSGAGARTAEGT